LDDELGNRRRYPRTNVLWSGEVAAGERRAGCTVLNVSAGGAKVRLSEPVDMRGDLTLRIGEFGEFVGTVVWKARNLLGISFAADAIEVGERLGAVLPQCWQDAALV
jgi:hypothetical protein